MQILIQSLVDETKSNKELQQVALNKYGVFISIEEIKNFYVDKHEQENKSFNNLMLWKYGAKLHWS